MSGLNNKRTRSQRAALVAGVVLVVVGLWGLVGAVVPGWLWAYAAGVVRAVWGVLWPLALVCAGVYLLWAVKSGKFANLSAASRTRTFRRSRADRRILGVCGGIAYYFGIDSVVVRVAAVILLVAFPPSAVVAYLLIALLVPPA